MRRLGKNLRSQKVNNSRHLIRQGFRVPNNAEACRTAVLFRRAARCNLRRILKPDAAPQRIFEVQNIVGVVTNEFRALPVEGQNIIRGGKKAQLYRVSASRTARSVHSNNCVHNCILWFCGNNKVGKESRKIFFFRKTVMAAGFFKSNHKTKKIFHGAGVGHKLVAFEFRKGNDYISFQILLCKINIFYDLSVRTGNLNVFLKISPFTAVPDNLVVHSGGLGSSSRTRNGR